jgi:membrane protein
MATSGLVTFGKRLVAQIGEDEVPDLAAGLAYRFLFAIFPFAIFLAALTAFVAQWLGIDDPTGEIVGALADNLPADVAGQLTPQLQSVLGETRPGLLSLGAIAALWAATGGVSALIKAMNTAYDVEDTRGFVARTVRAVVLTLLATAGILVAFVTIVGGSVLTQQTAEALGVGGTAWAVITLLRYPVVLGVVALAVALLFHFGPNVRVSFRWAFVGGLVFAVGWMTATVLFALYVANFTNYANTYGALGGVVVLMLWFYLTALLLLVAAEITSLLVEDRDAHLLAARRKVLAQRAGFGDAPALVDRRRRPDRRGPLGQAG